MLAADLSVAKPGLVAFAVVAGLGMAAFLLFRSMNNRIKNIRFDEGEASPGDESQGGDAAGGRDESAGRDDSAGGDGNGSPGSGSGRGA